MAEILDIAQLIKKLALIEEEGVAFYESLVQRTENEKVKKLAGLMARAERVHQQGFEKLSKTLEKRRKPRPSDKLPADFKRYVLSLIDHRIFLSPEQAGTLAKNITDLKEAIEMAIRFEKENILLLLECRDIASGATRKLLDKIIGQEKRHILGLRKAGQELEKNR